MARRNRSYKKRTMRKTMRGGYTCGLYGAEYKCVGGSKKRTMRKKMRGGACYNHGGKTMCVVY